MYKETKKQSTIKKGDNMKKISKTLYDWSVDMNMILNTDETNTKISILNERNKCTLKMNTCSMVYGSDLIKLLEKILECYKDSIHQDRYYSYGDIINILFRILFEQEMYDDVDLYNALDDWYWGKKDCEEEDD